MQQFPFPSDPTSNTTPPFAPSTAPAFTKDITNEMPFIDNSEDILFNQDSSFEDIPNEDIPNEDIPNEDISNEDISNELTIENIEQSPITAVNTFTPQLQNTMSVIGVIKPANLDNLMKILNTLIKEKSTDRISIINSEVKQSSGSYHITANLTKILNYEGKLISFDIPNPKKYVKKFSSFKKDTDIYILDDDHNKRFVLTNGEVNLFLPKQDATAEEQSSFDFTGSIGISQINIDKDCRKIIKDLSSDEEYVEYLLQDGQIKAIHIPNVAKYVFKGYESDPKISMLDESTADLTLRSDSFLPIESNIYNISIYKMINDTYVSCVRCQIGGQIDVIILEQINITSGNNLLF